MNTNRLTSEEIQHLRNIDLSTKPGLVDGESILSLIIGEKGSDSRSEFNSRALVWYYTEILRDRRKELQLSQKELAQRIGKETKYIQHIENGDTDIPLSSFIQLAEALGIRLRMDVSLA